MKEKIYGFTIGRRPSTVVLLSQQMFLPKRYSALSLASPRRGRMVRLRPYLVSVSAVDNSFSLYSANTLRLVGWLIPNSIGGFKPVG